MVIKYTDNWPLWTKRHRPLEGCFNNDKLKVVRVEEKARKLNNTNREGMRLAISLWQVEIDYRNVNRNKE